MSRIMIVDDDPAILKWCDAILAASGHEAVLCQDPYKAVEILANHQVDLLVIDVVMPTMNGLNLLKTIRGFAHFHAPVLMLTGKTTAKDVKAALDAGATDYMCKPFDKDIFLAKVRSLVGHQHEMAEVSFAVGSANTRAEVAIAAVVSTVTEMGMNVRTAGYVDRNLRVRLNSTLFQDLGIEPPPLRIVSCKALENDTQFGYEVFVSFVGLDELTMRKIRRWIAARTIATRRVNVA